MLQSRSPSQTRAKNLSNSPLPSSRQGRLFRRDLEDLCRTMEQRQIRPVIDSVFSFDEAKAGWSHYAGRKVTGKVVISH
jgi:NADPH:quinone reductase-like Zn-dependent oxidoreductase